MFFGATIAAFMMLADTTPAAAAAATTSASTPPAAAAPAAKTAKPKVVCKTESVTGSLFPKKTCYTEDEMAQRRQDERQNLERMQSQLPIKSN